MSSSDVNIQYYDEVSGRSLSSRTLRIWAYMFIPSDATDSEARAWLLSQGPKVSKTVRDVIVSIHRQDLILAAWRAGDDTAKDDDLERLARESEFRSLWSPEPWVSC